MPSTLNLQQCTHGVNIRYLYKFLPKLGFPVYVKHFCSVSSHMDWAGREGDENDLLVFQYGLSQFVVFQKLQCWIQLEMTAILPYHYSVSSGSSAVWVTGSSWSLMFKSSSLETSVVLNGNESYKSVSKQRPAGAVSSWFNVPLIVHVSSW